MHHCQRDDQLNYNDTLKFVPTMEVSGNEKAKNVKYLTYMTFNQTTHHSIKSNEIQERHNLTFLTLNMTFRTHSQCIYFSITLASPHHDVMKLKSDKEQNNAYISFWPSDVSLE